MTFDFAPASTSTAPAQDVLYTPVVRPPTPAPSPRPLSDSALFSPFPSPSPPPLPSSPSSSTAPRPHPHPHPLSPPDVLAAQFASLSTADRHRTLAALIPLLTPTEISTVHALLAPLLKRDILASLPPELALCVLAHVDGPRALCRAASVSRTWNALVDDDVGVWRPMCRRWAYVWPDEEAAPFEPERGPRTWKELFRYSYSNYHNWRDRPVLLRSQRLATHSPDPVLATITSSALSRTLLVTGLADARIHVFAARTGMALRQLVGHESGVWAVALVTSGGGLDARHRRVLETSAAAAGPGGVGNSNGNGNGGSGAGIANPTPPSTPTTGLAVQAHNRAPVGNDVRDPARLDHLLPLSLRAALALDRPPSWLPTSARESARERADPCGASRGWGQPASLVLSAGSDKTVRVWDADTGVCLYVLRGHTSTVRTLRVLHNRPVAISGARDGSMRVWDIQHGALLRVLRGHTASVRVLETYGDEAVSGSYDRTCRLWNVDSGECLQVFRGHQAQIYCVAYDGARARVASGGVDTAVRVWDARSGVCLAQLKVHTALVCQLQMTERFLVSGGADGRVTVITLDDGDDSSATEAGGRSGSESGSRSGSGRSMSTRPGGIRIAQRLTPHDSSITALQLVCDDRLLVTSGNDGRARLWDLDAGGRYVREMSDGGDGVWGVVFRREGGAVLCCRAGKMVVETWAFGPEMGR